MKTTIEVISSLNSRTHGNATYYSQEVAVHTEGEQYPDKRIINIEGQNAAYPKGFYEMLVGPSLANDSYGVMTLARYPKLTPVKQ